jgi:hypothetical protein
MRVPVRFFAIVWLATLLVMSSAPSAQPLDEPACVIVFGHGRNFEPGQDDQNEVWDRLNQRFNQQVLRSLELAGRRGVPLVLKSSATDLQRNMGLLLAQAKANNCSQVLETTLFGDQQTLTLKARLRLYPVLGAKGPRVANADLSIGEPLYSNERDFEFTRRVLERLNPATLGQAMAQESMPHLLSGGKVSP